MNRLSFTAPVDSAALRVRLRGPSGEVRDWVASPFEPTKELADVAQGSYLATLEPLGQPPVTFGFQVEAAETQVQAPRLTELRSGGAYIAEAQLTPALRDSPAGGGATSSAEPPPLTDAQKLALASAGEMRRFALGLSENTPYRRGRWRPYAGSAARIEPAASGVDVVVADTESADEPLRLRMSMAREGFPVERFLAPRYHGGVRVSFRASSLTTADVVVRILPEDPERRALVQALEAGSADEAKVLCMSLASSALGAALAERAGSIADPWTALVVSLLAERFPAFRELALPRWGDLDDTLGWIADVHALVAREHLRGAAADDASRQVAADRALDALTRARRTGAPYFTQTSNLVGEMLGALAAGAPTKEQRTWASAEQTRWRRALTVRGNLGVAFSWQVASRSPKEGVASSSEAGRPRTRSLSTRFTAILFQGELGLAQIRAIPPSKSAKPPPRSERSKGELRKSITRGSDPPAFQLPIRRQLDPNWGRFGRKAEQQGFRLGVDFGATRGRWVDLTLKVDAPPQSVRPYEDFVEFYLHDSFEPDHLRVVFRGDRASLPCTAFGGFTVGAWLPHQGVELELDLAQVEGAPERIRDY